MSSLLPAMMLGRRQEMDAEEGLWSSVAQSLLSAGDRIRYGMSPEEMHMAAVSGGVPGSVPNPSEERLPEEQRRAAAYYFGKRFPAIAQPAVRATNAFRSFAPGINPFADDPETRQRLHEIAMNAVVRGIRDAE